MLLLLPLSMLGQTVAERAKIVSTYDQGLIQRNKAAAAAAFKEQQQRISAYVALHPYVKSELKSLQRIEDDGTPIFYTTYNANSSKTINTNKMYPGGTLGLSVTGAGMTAGVWDGGKVRNNACGIPQQ